MSMGKAAIYKHIPVYYPNNVGSVAGIVGLIGGLGGFFLPLAFRHHERPDRRLDKLLHASCLRWLPSR
jgi:nitrate/nitrite transporter NarK